METGLFAIAFGAIVLGAVALLGSWSRAIGGLFLFAGLVSLLVDIATAIVQKLS